MEVQKKQQLKVSYNLEYSRIKARFYILNSNTIESYEDTSVWLSLKEISIKYKTFLEKTVLSVAEFQLKKLPCFSNTVEIIQYQLPMAVPHLAVSFLF